MSRFPRVIVPVLVAVIVTLSVDCGVASALQQYAWYLSGCYGPNVECWDVDTNPAAGPLDPSTDQDDIVDAGYLTTHISVPGGGAPGPGDWGYAAYGDGGGSNRVSMGLYRPQPVNDEPLTGFTTPTPYSSYQMSDEIPSGFVTTLQASGEEWGNFMDGDGDVSCTYYCGMGHTAWLVNSSNQNADYPWGSAFGNNPTLHVTATFDPVRDDASNNPSSYGTPSDWHADLCPTLLIPGTGGPLGINSSYKVELCGEVWRSDAYAPSPQVSPGDGGYEATSQLGNSNLYMTSTGHATTLDNVMGSQSYGFTISTSQIETIVSAINAAGGIDGYQLNTNPATYDLWYLQAIYEGGGDNTDGSAYLAGNTSDLQAVTCYDGSC